jgi:hypothetical protein
MMIVVSINDILASERLYMSNINRPAPGYINLSNSIGSNSPFSLFDNYGMIKYFENSYNGGVQKHLSNGQWIIVSPDPNLLYIYDKKLQLTDSIRLPFTSDTFFINNHDFMLLSNNRFMIAMTKVKIMDLSHIVDGGQTNARVMGQTLMEVDKAGNIYWSWDCFDYHDITEVTNDVDLTQMVIDFTHFNSFALDLDGNLLVSFRNIDQVMKINRTNGNIIWRIGGSASKSNQFQFTNDTENGFYGFSHQHSIFILPNGNLLLYDNGNMKPIFYSRAVEYQLDQTNKIATKVWEYRHSPDISAENMGNVQRLSNGNTLINWGTQLVTEVKPDNTVAMEFTITTIYRVEKLIINMDAVTKRITTSGNYNFNNQSYNTGINLNVSSLNGGGTVWAEKHYYQPSSMTFQNNDYSSVLPYRWIINSDSIASMSANLIINIDGLDSIINPNKLSIYKRVNETTGAFSVLNTSYNSGTKELSAPVSSFGEILICSNLLSQPKTLIPIDSAISIPVSNQFVWSKLKGATAYHLQVSSHSDFSNNHFNDLIQNDTTITVNLLDYNKRYFWRLRGINLKDTSAWSVVKTFHTKLPAPKLTYPNNNLIGLKLIDSLKWESLGEGIKYNIQLSRNSNFTTKLIDTFDILANHLDLSLNSYNTEFFWRVKAYRKGDTSQWSDTYNFITTLNSPQLLSPKNDSLNLPINFNFKWSSIQDAQSYTLQLSTDNKFDKNIQEFVIINKISHDIYNLNYAENYYWRVRAVRYSDSSEFSSIYKFSTMLTKLGLKYPKNDTNNVMGQILFSWDKVSDEAFYQLQISYSEKFDSLYQDVEYIDKNFYTLKNFPNYLKLYWRVRYKLYSKISEWSETRFFTTGLNNGLQSPELLSPKNNSINNNISSAFVWQSVKDAKHYTIEVAGDMEFSKIIVHQEKILVTSHLYENFEYSKNYYWRVKAFSDIDSSEWSLTWKMTTNNQPVLKPLTLINPGYDEMQVKIEGNLIWSEVVNAIRYHLQLSTDQNFIELIIDNTKININNFSFSDLSKNTSYFWRVRYFSPDDSSDWSDIWEFRTETENKLLAPKLRDPNINNVAVPVEGVLAWEEVDDATTYKISISKSQNFYPRVINISWHKELELQYSNLDYNTTYYWRVAGQNDNASSIWSDTKSFLTELKQPNLNYPENYADEQSVKGELIWDYAEGATAYSVQISYNNDFDELIVEENSSGNKLNYNLQDDKMYFWRVKAINEINWSRWSETWQFFVNDATSVKDYMDSEIVIVYPNPIKNSAYIKIEDVEIIKPEFILTNSLGIVISNLEINKMDNNFYRINTEYLSNGVYFLLIKTDKSILMEKLVIIK